MSSLSHSLQFVLVALAGCVNRQQRDVIDYLQEENRVLRELCMANSKIGQHFLRGLRSC